MRPRHLNLTVTKLLDRKDTFLLCEIELGEKSLVYVQHGDSFDYEGVKYRVSDEDMIPPWSGWRCWRVLAREWPHDITIPIGTPLRHKFMDGKGLVEVRPLKIPA